MVKWKKDDVIGFYPREFYCLDNFSSFKVEYNGYLYSSLEVIFTNLSFVIFPALISNDTAIVKISIVCKTLKFVFG